MTFRDRVDAGRQLGERLQPLFGDDVVVLGLPRGGVPVAAEVARALHAPLDVVVVRKLGVPWQPELAMGAIGEDGVIVWNDDVRRQALVPAADVAAIVAREQAEVTRRAGALRGATTSGPGTDRPSPAGRVVVVVDDGIATGSTVTAACRTLRARGAARIVVAVPVAPATVVSALHAEADEVICLHSPSQFSSVGRWYDDFSQVSDDEVRRLLSDRQAAAGDEL